MKCKSGINHGVESSVAVGEAKTAVGAAVGVVLTEFHPQDPRPRVRAERR